MLLRRSLTCLCPSAAHRSTPQPSLKLVSPYGEAFQGFHCGPQATAVLPSEIAVSLLSECVPFHQDVLLIAPLSASRDAAQELRLVDVGFAQQVKELFKTVRVEPLRPRTGQTSVSDGAVGHKFPPQRSPTESLAASSLDVICFTPVAFAELSQHHPYFLTSCHNALRPHGVVGIADTRRLRVVEPAWAAAEYRDLCEYLTEHCPSSPEREAAERARESIEVMYKDVYLPFPHVKRRLFTSQYRISVAELVASIRSFAEYQLMMRSSAPPRQGDPIGVVRRSLGPTVLDPLEAFLGLMEARCAGDYRLLVEVDAFLVTCDARPHNVLGEARGAVGALGSGLGLLQES